MAGHRSTFLVAALLVAVGILGGGGLGDRPAGDADGDFIPDDHASGSVRSRSSS